MRLRAQIHQNPVSTPALSQTVYMNKSASRSEKICKPDPRVLAIEINIYSTDKNDIDSLDIYLKAYNHGVI